MALRLSRRETGKMRLGESIFRIDLESILIIEYQRECPHSLTFVYALLDPQGRGLCGKTVWIFRFFQVSVGRSVCRAQPSDHPLVARTGKKDNLLGTAVGRNLAISLS
jgi:hypothetical protein